MYACFRGVGIGRVRLTSDTTSLLTNGPKSGHISVVAHSFISLAADENSGLYPILRGLSNDLKDTIFYYTAL